MKAQKGRKTRLVKASSDAADHNKWQAARIPTNEAPPKRRKRERRKPFNPVLDKSDEDILRELQARLLELDRQMKCITCPPATLERLKAETKACFKAIKRVERRMADPSPKILREDVRSMMRSEVYRVTKADARIPKTSGRGLRGKPEPYTGPGKPTNNIPAGRKPTIVFVEKQPTPDKLKFAKPLRSENGAFRTWVSGAVKRKKE